MDGQIDKIAIYKMSARVTNFEECMSDKILKNKIVDIETKSLVGKFYYDEIGTVTYKENIPWISFFNEKITNKISGDYLNKYPRGAFFYKIKGTQDFYVSLFGLGADSFINKAMIVFDFGIKVAMNLCDPDNLKRVQSSKVEAIAVHSEKQINNGAKLSTFNIDDEKEFLRKISAKPLPGHKNISVITGAESISVKFSKDDKLSWDKLKSMTTELNELYSSQKYKEIFKNYDNFNILNDKNPLVGELDDILLKNMKQGIIDKIYLTSPEFFDYEKFEFAYNKPQKDKNNEIQRYDELSYSECFERYKIKDTTKIEALKSWDVYKYDIEKNIYTKLASVYKCLVAEIDYKDGKFILFNGRWRQVDKSLQEKVSNYFNNEGVCFEAYNDELLLNNVSIWDVKSNKFKEAVYNEKCAGNNPNIFMFDRSNIDYGEMCDLFSLNKELIHVKRYGNGSASISHLFVQAKYYTDLFISEADARKQMREFIDEDILDVNAVNYQKDASKFKEIIPEKSPNDNDYTVILCILSEQKKALCDLPFMAQYEMYQTHKYLTNNRHFKVKLVNKIINKQH